MGRSNRDGGSTICIPHVHFGILMRSQVNKIKQVIGFISRLHNVCQISLVSLVVNMFNLNS